MEIKTVNVASQCCVFHLLVNYDKSDNCDKSDNNIVPNWSCRECNNNWAIMFTLRLTMSTRWPLHFTGYKYELVYV